MPINMNNSMNMYYNNTFRSNDDSSAVVGNAPKIITKPVKQVETVVNKTVDTFIKQPEKEEDKKSHKKAIAVGSTVLVLSGLVAMLNPRFSGKFVEKLKVWSQKAESKMHRNKDSFMKTKFYGYAHKAFKNVANFAQFTNTINTTKDVGYNWLCSAEKFKGIKNDTLRKFLQTINSGFTKVMTPVNNAITKWFDKVGQKTVFKKYKKALSRMSDYENAVKMYRGKLSPKEQLLLDRKLKEIADAKKFFDKAQVQARFKDQESVMSHINEDFKNRLFNDYFKKFKFKGPESFKDKSKSNWQLIKDNMSFWAEDMLMPERNRLEKIGTSNVSKLVGDGKDVKGLYQDVFDILSPHLKDEERKFLQKGLKKSSTKLNKAVHSECIEYFDKKRDLVLGGAPTDILSGGLVLGASGIAIGKADSKEDRTSRALTMGMPAIAGLGTSIAMTAMLFSGIQGMAIGGLASAGFSKLGSMADKYLNPKSTIDSNKSVDNPVENPINKKPEVHVA